MTIKFFKTLLDWDGEIRNITKWNHRFLCPLSTCPENFIEIIHHFLSYFANNQADRCLLPWQNYCIIDIFITKTSVFQWILSKFSSVFKCDKHSHHCVWSLWGANLRIQWRAVCQRPWANSRVQGPHIIIFIIPCLKLDSDFSEAF